MLDFRWSAGKSVENFPDDYLVCPRCDGRGIYYETGIQGQVCTECNKEFEGVVVKKLTVTVIR